jgi:hypothetical protein
MTIESLLTSIAASLSRIADAMEGQTTVPAATPTPGAYKPSEEQLQHAYDHARNQPDPTPAPVVPVPPMPTMPATPTPAFVPMPAPVPSTVVAPFNDAKGLMDYVMTKYKALGPIKGGMIQQVLLDLGHSNMSSVPASQYADFYLKVEAL